ncbi:MAG: HPr family phosphocarrier protein, partial [Bdellovibrionales bacterium]|nr:HPr family phosphocarrier protein [Bdellovibrionales bacterium]
LAKTAAGFSCKVMIRVGGTAVNAKSVMSVMSLGLEKGAEFTLITEGADEAAALERLTSLIEHELSNA